jgi:protein dithiol oxidoreductase (disulfide-forming)
MKNWIAGAAAALLMSTAVAADYELGVHYEELRTPQPVQTGDQIEVVEIFWYGCPYCYSLEPHVHRWLENAKPDNADYVPMPAVLSEAWEIHARAFFAFELLGALDELHTRFFDAIHADRRRMRNAEEIAEFAAENGLEQQAFLDAYSSFAVDSKVRNAQVMAGRYQVTGVPTFIIDGRYKATASMAGSNEELMRVINYLVAKAADERS